MKLCQFDLLLHLTHGALNCVYYKKVLIIMYTEKWKAIVILFTSQVYLLCLLFYEEKVLPDSLMSLLGRGGEEAHHPDCSSLKKKISAQEGDVFPSTTTAIIRHKEEVPYYEDDNDDVGLKKKKWNILYSSWPRRMVRLDCGTIFACV